MALPIVAIHFGLVFSGLIPPSHGDSRPIVDPPNDQDVLVGIVLFSCAAVALLLIGIICYVFGVKRSMDWNYCGLFGHYDEKCSKRTEDEKGNNFTVEKVKIMEDNDPEKNTTAVRCTDPLWIQADNKNQP